MSVTGQVLNHNGLPMPQVWVSDSQHLTSTDSNGSFELPGTGFITLVRPSGWTTERWWRHPDDPDLGFTLRPVRQTLPLRLLQVTDLHLLEDDDRQQSDGEKWGMQCPGPVDAGRELARLTAAAGTLDALLITGDLVNTGTDGEYRALAHVLSSVTTPVIALPGNTDHKAGVHYDMTITDTGYLINGHCQQHWHTHMGPRWYSLDIADLHIVAIDWNTWERGVDRQQQNQWLVADLTAHHRRPWVLLAHDNPHPSFFDQLPCQPEAVITGHWHTDRVIRHNDTLFVNTPTAFVAGLDHTPPSTRVITWDGTRIACAHPQPTTAPHRRQPETLVWQREGRISSRTSSGLLAAGPLLLAVEAPEHPGDPGSLIALDATTGTTRWTTPTPNVAVAEPQLGADIAVVQDITGTAIGVEVETGQRLWIDHSDDPLRDWCLTRPAVTTDSVIVGYPGTLRCLDLRTGARRWTYPRPFPHFNNVPHAGITIADNLVLLGVAHLRPALIALDLATGQVLWHLDSPDQPSRHHTPIPAIPNGFQPGPGNAHLDWFGWAPVGPGYTTPDRTTVVFPAAGHLYAIRAATGEILWDTQVDAVFNPSQPAVTGNHVICAASDSTIQAHDLTTGSLAWTTTFETETTSPRIPFRRTPHGPIFGPTTATDTAILVPGLDGYIHQLHPTTGRQLTAIDVGSPVLSRLTITDHDVAGVSADGAAFRVQLPSNA